MRLLLTLGLGLSLVFSGGCNDTSATGSGGASGSGGGGGASGSGGGAGTAGHGGSGGIDCATIDRACRPLDANDCAMHQDECEAVEGSLWQTDLEDCLAQPRVFLACRAGCLESPDVPTCVYDPSSAEECYCLPNASVPSGWEELFECQIPEGLCGT